MDIETLAFEEAPVGIVLTECRIIRACNLTFSSMLGYRREDLIGQSFRMLYPSGEEFDRIRDIGLEPLKRDEYYSDERMMSTANGVMIWCRFRAHSLTPSDPLAQVVMSFTRIADTPPVALSPRERQVLGGIGRGLTSKEIAHELGLSPRTIDDVRARLLRRFSVRNAAELLAKLTYLDQ
ncbi:PAS domain S-box-containing protein [Salinihabitans flavidus]|uniref:PAS domain S-box-containing protein n=1 Tax=Salinihabitans flavidus TaxID=569882 RepID=A0A1H8NVJ4_9RHOB|nr:PAS and helix-turn-helix domain-containing protein [Salinihabitans flavidus]SEO33582.1 PAS domain S-box-containing protein [Salinihabitans flavidus]